AQAREAGEFFAWAGDRGIAVITTSARATESFWDASYPRPLALLLGAEGGGLPGEVLARGDICLRIPMVGTAESLNLAVAAGLLLGRNWYRPPAPEGGLTADGFPPDSEAMTHAW